LRTDSCKKRSKLTLDHEFQLMWVKFNNYNNASTQIQDDKMITILFF
jgi:hypothetical protein